jgi:phosphate uptake regulator
MHLMAASKALERIADHIKNIAGNIVFLVEGVDLRRLTRPSTRPDAPPAEL